MFVLNNQISNYRNRGQAIQQDLTYQLTGAIRPADHIPFDQGSDIPEFNMSVKTYHFTLASNLNGSTYEEMRDDFFARCASTTFAYVTRERLVYIMNRSEFREFLDQFHELDTDSRTRKAVIRGKREPKAMLKWLDELDYMREWL